MAHITPTQSGTSAVATAITPRATQVGGDITLANTAGTSAELAAATGGPGTAGLDLTLTGVVAGDVVLVTVAATAYHTATASVEMDLATMVSGSVVNWLGQSAGAMVSKNGFVGASIVSSGASVYANMAASLPYTVQAGDLSSGTLILRPHYGASIAAHIARSQTSGNGPLIFGVVNLKH